MLLSAAYSLSLSRMKCFYCLLEAFSHPPSIMSWLVFQVARSRIVLIVIIGLTAQLAELTAGQPQERYRLFGFTQLPTNTTVLNDSTAGGWMSIDIQLSSIVWAAGTNASTTTSSGEALANISIAITAPPSTTQSTNHSFQSVICNGELVNLVRDSDNISTANRNATFTAVFPFMSNPFSCVMRFLWSYCGEPWASCDAGMNLIWKTIAAVERDAQLRIEAWNITGVHLNHADMTSTQQRHAPQVRTPSSFCGQHRRAATELHIRIDVFGGSNRWVSLANTTTAEGGASLTPNTHETSCRMRPVKTLRVLRELSFGPYAGLEPLTIAQQLDGGTTLWPLNYVAPPLISGSLPNQPPCFAETIAWYTGGDVRGQSVRVFQPMDDLLVIVAMNTNQSTQYVSMVPCASSSVAPSTEQAAATPWLGPAITQRLASNGTTFAFCGGYGGTPDILIRIHNFTFVGEDALVLSGSFTVTANGFTAPACPAEMTFNITSATSDGLVFVTVRSGAGARYADCLDWALANVGRTPWYQLQYDLDNDRFWMATSFGAFPLSACLQRP